MLIVLPVSTADCERGFSNQNLIQTSLRNSRSTTILQNVMKISKDGPSIEEMDFSSAFKVWAGMKSRRIFNHFI